MWTYAERITAQGVSFIVSVILSRRIDPEHFGTISLVLIFIGICNVFVTNGFGVGLVQKKKIDDLDFSTVFFFSIFIGITLYALVFFSAPFLSDFFECGDITLVIRIIALRIPIASINTIQHSYVERHMLFRKFFFSTLGGTLASAVVGITMAYMGFGIWALVFQYLTNTVIDTIVLFFTVDWRPHLQFSFMRLKPMFSFGWKVLAASLIDTLYTDLRNFIIGKRYSSADLAYYNKGYQIPHMIVVNINASLSKVLFPALSMKQEEPDAIRSMVSRTIKTSTYLMCPLLIGLFVVAKPLVLLLYTEKWLDSVLYIQIFSITYLFMPINSINQQAIKAVGRSDISLIVEIVKKVFGVALIIATVVFLDTPIALAGSFSIYTFISLFINAYPGKKLYSYSCLEQILDILPALCIGVVMGIITYIPSSFISNYFILLPLQVVIGAIVYIGLSRLFKLEAFVFTKNALLGFIQNKKDITKKEKQSGKSYK